VYSFSMKAALKFKVESQEKLAILTTLQGCEIERQHQKIANLRNQLRERDGEVQEVFLEDPPKIEEEIIAPSKLKKKTKIKTPKKGHGPTEQGNIKYIDQVHLLDESNEICPSCGGELVEWDGQFEGADLVDPLHAHILEKKIVGIDTFAFKGSWWYTYDKLAKTNEDRVPQLVMR